MSSLTNNGLEVQRELSLYQMSMDQLLFADAVEEGRLRDAGVGRNVAGAHMMYGELLCEGTVVELVTLLSPERAGKARLPYVVRLTVFDDEATQRRLNYGGYLVKPPIYEAHRNGSLEVITVEAGMVRPRYLNPYRERDAEVGKRLLHLVRDGHIISGEQRVRS